MLAVIRKNTSRQLFVSWRLMPVLRKNRVAALAPKRVGPKGRIAKVPKPAEDWDRIRFGAVTLVEGILVSESTGVAQETRSTSRLVSRSCPRADRVRRPELNVHREMRVRPFYSDRDSDIIRLRPATSYRIAPAP